MCASPFGACESFSLASKYYLDFAAAGSGDNSRRKRHYRARVVRRMLCNIASERDINVNILEAMQMFSAAWRALKEEIISNYFRKAGVVYAEDDIIESEVLDDAETEEN